MINLTSFHIVSDNSVFAGTFRIWYFWNRQNLPNQNEKDHKDSTKTERVATK